MTGDELLAAIQAIPSDQRKNEVLVEGEDMFRDRIFLPIVGVRIAIIKDSQEDNDGDECIVVERS